MHELRVRLEQRLSDMKDLKIDLWRDTDLVCLFYKGKDFAHFHGDLVLDLRLSQKIIRQEGLSRQVSQRFHPDRSPNSRWICVEIKNENDVETTYRLVELACNELI